MSDEQLAAAIDRLGVLDYAIRTSASRTVRRVPAVQAIPTLTRAVAEHADGYVRYRALVLLTGFNDPRTVDSMRSSLKSPNDRLRAVAYGFFERHPDASMASDFLDALDKEPGEFVRPALVRALAALGAEPRVQRALVRDAGRGDDFFRSAVIEALGDYRATYALDALTAVARLEGPLQDDAALALGKIGDKRAIETLAGLQRTAAPSMQPAVATAICLLGVNCQTHEPYLIDTLRFADKNSGYQDLLRGAAAGLGALAIAGHREALDALFEVGLPSRDPTRAPITLALATVALRSTPILLTTLQQHPDRERAIALVGEGFDMLEEDLDKEIFFATIRRTYWNAEVASPARSLTQALIGKLDF